MRFGNFASGSSHCGDDDDDDYVGVAEDGEDDADDEDAVARCASALIKIRSVIFPPVVGLTVVMMWQFWSCNATSSTMKIRSLVGSYRLVIVTQQGHGGSANFVFGYVNWLSVPAFLVKGALRGTWRLILWHACTSCLRSNTHPAKLRGMYDDDGDDGDDAVASGDD